VADEAVERFEGLVRKSLIGCGVSAGSFVLAAYSGGPDSTALSLALARLKTEIGFHLELGYVDHGIRPEAELEKELETVRAFAVALGCKLWVRNLGRGAVVERARREKRGIEAAARALRYRALAATMPEGESTYLALGHTLSDQSETMVDRFFSGSGIRGLRGIPASGHRELEIDAGRSRSFILIRPLLELEKRDVLGYLKAHGATWSTDSTNKSPLYRRNEIRLELLPRVQAMYPGFVKSLGKMGLKLARIESYLDEAAGGIFRKEGETWRAEASVFYASHFALRQHALEIAMADLARGRRLPFAFIDACVEARRDFEGLKKDPLRGCGLAMEAAGAAIILKRRLAHGPKKGYFFPIVRQGRYGPAEGLEFELFTSQDAESGPALDSFSFPLVLRSVRPADKIAIKGGKKLVNDLLAEWGVPEAERSMVPVLEDEQGILCVCGGSLGFRNRFAERGFAPGSADGRYMALKVTEKVD
jgi:tRNA(Ile)-lysidine synthetase-like protein